MILLDTNVAYEPTKPSPDPRVLRWIDDQMLDTLHLPSPALAELLVGIEQLPEGHKKTRLAAIIHNLVAEALGPRILAFDKDAAERYALLSTRAQRKGVLVTFGDGQIAAIADVHGLTVATRDTAPFLAMEIPVINPWET